MCFDESKKAFVRVVLYLTESPLAYSDDFQDIFSLDL